MNHGSSIDNKFHYQNYQNLGFQTAVDNIYAMGNEWTCINPYPYFQFPFLVNPPVKQEMAYNGNINPFFFTNQ